MSSVKDTCKSSIQKLTASADMCDKYVKGNSTRKDCIQPAKDVVTASKKVIEVCREHIKNCKNSACNTACQACIKTAEKAVGKNTACFDACGGKSSDNDCKVVCKDCADACRACIKTCQDCITKVCS